MSNRRRGKDPNLEFVLKQWLPLVQNIARRTLRHLPASVDFDDLVSAGTLGLIDAVEKFDATRNNTFRTYAAIRIQGAMYDELRAGDAISRSHREKERLITKTREVLQNKLGRKPSDLEMAQALDVTPEEYRATLALISIVQFSLTGTKDSRAIDIEDPGHKSASAHLETEEYKQVIQKALNSLPERQAAVIRLSFIEQLSLAEIGRLFEISESRVSQIRKVILSSLRKKISCN